MTTYVNGRIGTSDDTTATTTMAMTTYVNGRIVIAIVVIAVDAAYLFYILFSWCEQFALTC